MLNCVANYITTNLKETLLHRLSTYDNKHINCVNTLKIMFPKYYLVVFEYRIIILSLSEGSRTSNRLTSSFQLQIPRTYEHLTDILIGSIII